MRHAVSLLLLLIHSVAFAQSPGEPRIHRAAKGEYQHLWLTFDGDTQAKAFVPFRDATSTTAWFLQGHVPGGVKKSGTYRLLIDRTELAWDGKSLKGAIHLRQVSIWAAMKMLGKLTLTLDGAETGKEIRGTWRTEVEGGAKTEGTFRGTFLNEGTIRSSQTFAKGADWPCYHGPHGTNRASETVTALLDDLSAARPVWRSEAKLLSGWGSGVDSRYTSRAAFGTVCGGSGSPVFAEGRIFLFHYVPSGEPDAALVAKVLGDFEKQNGRAPNPEEKAGLIDYCRPHSDTIITCIDAQTGAVIWSVTFPELSGNFQTHKWRGLNPTVCVIGSVVIANDLGFNWVALNTKDGEVLWTLKGSRKVTGNAGAVGAVEAGGLAVLPGEKVRAVDPATGKVAWERPGGLQVLAFGKKGSDGVVVIGRSNPTCYESATGKLLWKLDEPLVGTSGSAALVQGDVLVGHLAAEAKQRGGNFQGWRVSKAGAKKLWQDEFLEFDENLSVSLGADKAYLLGRNQIRCLDLETGKKLGTFAPPPMADQLGIADRVGSNQWLAIVGDRLLLSPEGQHGGQSLQMLRADGKLDPLGKLWIPANNHTTAYGVHSLAYPVVDGRIFIRGMDGLYCYDLRK